MERLLTLYSEVQSTDVRWLWYPFIAIGKITLLQGDPGDGKSIRTGAASMLKVSAAFA